MDHIGAGLWLPTGGHVEPGEHPLDTAIRETREELGIDADFGLTGYRPGLPHGHTDDRCRRQTRQPLVRHHGWAGNRVHIGFKGIPKRSLVDRGQTRKPRPSTVRSALSPFHREGAFLGSWLESPYSAVTSMPRDDTANSWRGLARSTTRFGIRPRCALVARMVVRHPATNAGNGHRDDRHPDRTDSYR
ncbi:NUDIX domain-containing protein [Rhodococcus zopfii]|uniref:NUDIX domain-containing protein n=1 Tax=Rhodococcus zopfii TaxID=43772 RepID=UPI00237AA68A|nr:NUDIX domain-containing protein [Rhodococcus zopfii]